MIHAEVCSLIYHPGLGEFCPWLICTTNDGNFLRRVACDFSPIHVTRLSPVSGLGLARIVLNLRKTAAVDPQNCTTGGDWL